MEFLVPGGPGSGQDQAARAYEEALKSENLRVIARDRTPAGQGPPARRDRTRLVAVHHGEHDDHAVEVVCQKLSSRERHF
jgi:hypothetical protein